MSIDYDDEPRPGPEPPDMDGLFDRPERRTRMLSPVVTSPSPTRPPRAPAPDDQVTTVGDARASGPLIGGLFEGYGGLTAASRAVLGGSLAWYSEIDPAACKVLAHHHPGVPNLGDITEVDWRVVMPQGAPIDVLTGGFP